AAAHRALAVRPLLALGGTCALSSPAHQARALLGALAPSSLEIAVVDRPDRTVVSGRHAGLDRLRGRATHLGIAHTPGHGIGPHHARLMREAVPSWAAALRGLDWRPSERTFFSPHERAVFRPGADAPGLLASHLDRPLPLHDALVDMAAAGGRIFLECGGRE